MKWNQMLGEQTSVKNKKKHFEPYDLMCESHILEIKQMFWYNLLPFESKLWGSFSENYILMIRFSFALILI